MRITRMNRIRTQFIFAVFDFCLSVSLCVVHLSLWADVLFSEKRSSVCCKLLHQMVFFIALFLNPNFDIHFVRCLMRIYVSVARIVYISARCSNFTRYFRFYFRIASHEITRNSVGCEPLPSKCVPKQICNWCTIIHSVAFALFLFLLSLWISLIWQFHRWLGQWYERTSSTRAESNEISNLFSLQFCEWVCVCVSKYGPRERTMAGANVNRIKYLTFSICTIDGVQSNDHISRK